MWGQMNEDFQNYFDIYAEQVYNLYNIKQTSDLIMVAIVFKLF